MKNKIIGKCELNLGRGGCGQKLIKDMLSIYNDKIRKEVERRTWIDSSVVIGICKGCGHKLMVDEIEDNEVRLLIDI